MRATVIVPAKGFSRAKSRLGAALEADARARLAATLLAHVLTTLRAADAELELLVVTDGDDAHALGVQHGARVVRDDGGSLTHAVVAGMASSSREIAAVVMMADLPELSVDDVRALLAPLATSDVVIAPDPERVGTSALATRAGVDLPVEFGSGDSFARYQGWAQQRGLSVTFVERPGLSRDLDDPAALSRSPVVGS